MSDLSTFGKRFKGERLKKGLTQTELAKNFNRTYHHGFTKASISQYENNKRIPEIEALKDWADYFGVTIDYLLGGTDRIFSLSNDEQIELHVLKDEAGKYPEIDIISKALSEELKERVKSGVISEEKAQKYLETAIEQLNNMIPNVKGKGDSL